MRRGLALLVAGCTTGVVAEPGSEPEVEQPDEGDGDGDGSPSATQIGGEGTTTGPVVILPRPDAVDVPLDAWVFTWTDAPPTSDHHLRPAGGADLPGSVGELALTTGAAMTWFAPQRGLAAETE